jgi:hypothetical protein
MNRGRAKRIGAQLNTGFSQSQSLYVLWSGVLILGIKCGLSFAIVLEPKGFRNRRMVCHDRDDAAVNSLGIHRAIASEGLIFRGV